MLKVHCKPMRLWISLNITIIVGQFDSLQTSIEVIGTVFESTTLIVILGFYEIVYRNDIFDRIKLCMNMNSLMDSAFS